MPAIKPRPTPPLGYEGRIPTLFVHHPHYLTTDTLVKLPALDEGDTVDYNVALISAASSPTIAGVSADLLARPMVITYASEACRWLLSDHHAR